MAKKIVRDVLDKDPDSLSFSQKALKKSQKKSKNVLDLSMIDHNKTVMTSGEKKRMRDVQGAKAKKVIYREVDTLQKKPLDRIGEVIRLAAAGILILSLINIVNIYQRGLVLKDNIIASAVSGYEDLMNAKDNAQKAQFDQAGNAFNLADANFKAALETINFLESNQGIFYTKEKTVQSVQGLLQAGKNISMAGQNFAKGIEHVKQLPTLILQQNTDANLLSDDSTAPKISLTQKLQEDVTYLEMAIGNVQLANENLANVSMEVLPENFRSKLQNAQESLKKLLSLLQNVQKQMPVFLKLLGDRYQHSYLILLQNDSEVRPTGGFIGSYLLVDTNDGYITKNEFHDVYESDGLLKEEIPAPEDIAKITKNWRLRDSNYSPDFSISGEKAAWFLQKEKGPSVDTVIAINQHIIADLFDITGPIQLEGLSAPLTKENYQLVISYLVESKASGKEDPKKILRSFIPAFQKKLLESKAWDKILKVLVQSLQQKDILLYSRDEEIQEFFNGFGATGKTLNPEPQDDYLNVISVSIGGNKSDLYLKQNLNHTTFIDQDGTVNNQLIITREHTWNKGVLTQWKGLLSDFGFDAPSGDLQLILGKGSNKVITKVYVPLGSQLLESKGIAKEKIAIRQDEEIHKTYFMFEMDTAAGEKNTVSLTYKLPQKLDLVTADSYKLFVQRQPGITISNFEKQVTTKAGVQIYSQYPAAFGYNENHIMTLKGPLQKDVYLSVLVGK